MKAMQKFLAMLIVLTMLMGTHPVSIAHAAITLTVTKLADTNDGICDSDCSLREAVTAASGGDSITFDPSLAGGVIILSSQIVVDKNLTLDGSGLSPHVQISGGDITRVFYMNSGISVSINQLDIIHGSAANGGGGIYNNQGTLIITNCTFSNNVAGNYNGGGIYNYKGTLTVIDSYFSKNVSDIPYVGGNGAAIHNELGMLSVTGSTFTENQAGKDEFGSGASIYNNGGEVTVDRSIFSKNTSGDTAGGIYSHGSLKVTNSTFSQNQCGENGCGLYNRWGPAIIAGSTFFGNIGINSSYDASGGALFNWQQGTMTVINSTIFGNSVTGYYGKGGGIFNETGTLSIINSTISDNYARTDGGGVYNEGGTVYLKNSILANSTHGYDCYNISSDTIAMNNNSLIETNGPTGHSCGTPMLSSDPLLGPLADNGGPTQTMALSLDSPAIDAGNDTVCAEAATVNNLDQRGVLRPFRTHCDIGAYEKNNWQVFQSTGQTDGWVLESGENTNMGGAMDSTSTTLRIGDDFMRKQYRSLLSFDTSSLPDNAVITRVTLKVRRQSVVGGGHPVTDFQGFMADIRRGLFHAAALELTDWQTTANKTLGPLTLTSSGSWFILDLTGAKAYINKLGTYNGLTQIRLRFKLDDDGNRFANYLSLYSGNAGAASRPQLIIEYYVP